MRAFKTLLVTLILTLLSPLTQASSSLCEQPHQAFCSLKEVQDRMAELKAEQERIDLIQGELTKDELWDLLLEGRSYRRDSDTFWDLFKEGNDYLRATTIDPISEAVLKTIEAKGIKTLSPRQQNKVYQFKSLVLAYIVTTEWSPQYIPYEGNIDMGRFIYIRSPRLFEIVRRIAAHEMFHSFDPEVYFFGENGIDFPFDPEDYIFLNELREFQSIFPMGYSLQCLEDKIRAGESVQGSFMEQVKASPYARDNTYLRLGCGNGYASEAFADFMAHKYLLQGKNSAQTREYVIQQAAFFCRPQAHYPSSDPHPSFSQRFEDILFSFKQVRAAFSCE